MPEEEKPPVFEFNLGDYGERVRIQSFEELAAWNEKERNAWQWVNGGSPQTDYIVNEHAAFRSEITNYVNQWRNNQNNHEYVRQMFDPLAAVFDKFYCKRRIFHSGAPGTSFLSNLRQQKGDLTAAGAYAALLGSPVNLATATRAEFLVGIIEGFLYLREVDWTGSAHQEVLNRLKSQYADNLDQQAIRFKEIEARNATLNQGFEEALKERAKALETLHGDQSAEFKKLVEKHLENLTAIEKTYDQKLALQKPVEYWQTKERYHGKRSREFGMAELLATVAVVVGLGWLVHWTFGNLQPTEDPKHWQIGILVVAAFFSIWQIRILVRMFFSHHHLATDAAERRTMILTYLSMSREGAQFTAEDKKLILQHLFRAASDGLVRDDAAPPTIFELFTRK